MKRKSLYVAIILVMIMCLTMSIFLVGCANKTYNKLLNFVKTKGEKDPERDKDFGYTYTYEINSKVHMTYYTGSEYNDEITINFSQFGDEPSIAIDINNKLTTPYQWSAMYVNSKYSYDTVLLLRGTIDPNSASPGSTYGITITDYDSCIYNYKQTVAYSSLNSVKVLLSYMELFLSNNEDVGVSMVDLGFINFD